MEVKEIRRYACIFVGMTLCVTTATHEDKYDIIENKKQALESLFFLLSDCL